MSISRKEAKNIASVLVEGMPYIQRFSNKKIVIKYGGAAMLEDKLRQGFARDIALMKLVGMYPVVIHGGGPQIGAELERRNIQTKFLEGYRVTNKKTMTVVKKVLGREINNQIVQLIKSFGGNAESLSWFNSDLIKASKLNEGKLGLVGKVDSVKVSELNKLLKRNSIPIVSPIGIDKKGNYLNINADLVAGKMAHILQAGKYLILTNTTGILDDKDKLIKSINAHEVRNLIKKGVISKGMLPKIESALEAVSSGVEHVQIINGTIDHSVLLELFTDSGIGTMIRRL